MSGPGDEIRRTSIAPDVREALAKIVDAAGGWGEEIQKKLGKEIEARHAQAPGPSKEAHEYLAPMITNVVEIDPQLLKEQLAVVVKSQGFNQNSVDKLLETHDYEKLNKAVMAGVDAAIGAPLGSKAPFTRHR